MPEAATPPLDVDRIRADFPILARKVRDRPLVYLDNAASAQKPRLVIDAVNRFNCEQSANVHRGVHRLSEEATRAFEGARGKLAAHLNARETREIVFTRGTTESINLIARTFGEQLRPGDEIVVSCMEHHSNIVPWQLLAERVGTVLRVAPIDDSGALLLDEYAALLNDRTRLVAMVHTSNALGTRNPVERVTEIAHAHGVPVLLDAAQAMAHEAVDVQALDCDFLALSGHKMFGPTGIGALYGKAERLDPLPPFHGGGEMIQRVTFEKSTFREIPARFEAGTPNISGAIGLGAAVDYLAEIGMDRIAARDLDLLRYGTERLREIPQVRLIGTAEHKTSILTFTVEGIHPHDLATTLDLEGVAIRAGHHCTQPLMDRFGVHATARASMAFYNTHEEIDRLVDALHHSIEVFG